MSAEDRNGRKSWDQTAVLTAVKGPSYVFNQVHGRMLTEPSGYNRWSNNNFGPHSYLVFKKSPDEIAELIERCMMHESLSVKK